jgi:hypothetical protein
MSKIRNIAKMLGVTETSNPNQVSLTTKDSAIPHTLTVDPEVFTINVEAPDSGSSAMWKWHWDAGTVAYARLGVSGITQSNVPLYKAGSYTINNFAAHDIYGNMSQTHKIYLKNIEGAGVQNLSTWATSTLNIANQTHPDINGGSNTEIQRLQVNIPASFGTPSLSAPTVTYTVVNSGSGAYAFSGTATGSNPTLGPVRRGGTYTFNVNASGHPFYLTTDSAGLYSSGNYIGEYTTGVTGSRTDSGNVVWTVDSSTPDTMYYACGLHSSMFGTINVKDLAMDSNGSGLLTLYFQHDQEGHTTPVELREVPSIPGQVCLVYNASTNQFVPQDLGVYLDNTAQFKEKIVDLVGNDASSNFIDSAELTTRTSNFIDSAGLTTRLLNDILYNITLHQGSELTVTTGTARWYAPFNLSIKDIIPKLGTAADATVTALVKKNGSTEKTINFTAGQTTSTVASPTFTMNEGDYITIDVTAIGGSSPGEDLNIQFKYKRV